MDLSIPPTPLPGGLPPGTARGNRLVFRKIQISKPPPYEPLFQYPIFIDFRPLFGPQVGAFQRPKSPQRLFQANTKKNTKIIVFPRFWPHWPRFSCPSGRANSLENTIESALGAIFYWKIHPFHQIYLKKCENLIF